MIRIVNPHFPDGTSYDPPKNPLYEKYPECEIGEGYHCMFCSKCPHGEFTVPDEDKEIYENYEKAYKEYCDSHGGELNIIFDVINEEESKGEE